MLLPSSFKASSKDLTTIHLHFDFLEHADMCGPLGDFRIHV